jgi:hypothetical protein
MITLVLPSRVQNNPDSNIDLFLNSLKDSLDPKYYPLVEVIFKFDSDDNFTPTKEYFQKFPFTIKSCKFSPCNRRASYDLFVNYAFTLRNPSFKFVVNSADDFVFFRKNWIEDYFSMPKYCIIDSGFGSNGTRKLGRHNFETWEINKLLNGEVHPNSYGPIFSMIGEYAPSYTANIIEMAGNFGYQPSVDVWATILPGIMFHLYNVDIYRKIEPYCRRTGNPEHYVPKDKMLPWGVLMKASDQVRNQSHEGDGYNLMEDSGGPDGRKCKNPYYYKLVAQQAKNIYLNMVEDNEAK